MIINLLSPKGEKEAYKIGVFYFLNERKVKKLLKNGWTLESEEDADIAIKSGVPPPERLFTLIRNKSHN